MSKFITIIIIIGGFFFTPVLIGSLSLESEGGVLVM